MIALTPAQKVTEDAISALSDSCSCGSWSRQGAETPRDRGGFGSSCHDMFWNECPFLRGDGDRGEPRGSSPPTPPGIRVRTTAVREVALTRFEQGRETERFEVGIGEPHRERFAPGQVPRTTAAAGHIAQL